MADHGGNCHHWLRDSYETLFCLAANTLNSILLYLRLISARHVTKNKLYASLQAEKAKSGVQDLELAIRTGDDYFQTYAYGKKVKRDTAGEGGEASVVKMMDDDLLLPWQQVEGQDEEVTQALMGEGRRVKGEGLQREGVSLADVEASELESQAASSTGTPVCRSPFPDLEPHSGASYSLTPESTSKRTSQGNQSGLNSLAATISFLFEFCLQR